MENIEYISDWILSHLEEKGIVSDELLHWNACNKFLGRNLIRENPRELEKFSNNFDFALNYLRKEFYISHKDGDFWINSQRKKRKNLKISTKKEYSNKAITCFYIIEFEHGCKVGISSKFKARLRAYKSPWCREILNTYILHHENPKEIESHVLSVFKKNRSKNSECIYLNFDEIKKEVEAYAPLSIFEIFLH